MVFVAKSESFFLDTFMTSVVEGLRTSREVHQIPRPQGFSSLELPERFGPKVQQGPFDIWRHPGDSDLAIVVSTDRTADGDTEYGVGALRVRTAAFMADTVRREFPSNTIAVLHPNVLLVVPLVREKRARVTSADFKRPIDPHARRLSEKIGKVGKQADNVLKDAGYTLEEFSVRVGSNSRREQRLGLGFLTPGTAVIINQKNGDPLQASEDWEEMLSTLSGKRRTGIDSDVMSIKSVIETFASKR